MPIERSIRQHGKMEKRVIQRFASILIYFFSCFLCLSSCIMGQGKNARPHTIRNISPLTTGAERAILAPEDLIEVSTGPELDYQSALFIRQTDEAWQIVFERWKTAEFAGNLMIATSIDHKSFSPAIPMKLLDMPLQLSPKSLSLDDVTYLYFMAGNAEHKSTHFYRSLYKKGVFEVIEKIRLDDGFAGILAWPHPIAVSNLRIMLAYDNYRTANNLALSENGIDFKNIQRLGTGQMGRVAAFKDGQLVYTWQTGHGSSMTAWYRISRDGILWSESTPITNKSTNVHDAMPFSRLDGGIDIYYIYTGSSGYSIYRCSLSPDGKKGVEERVTSDSVGSVTQPHPHRLNDGRILLTFTREIVSQVDYDVACAVLENDSGT